MVNASYTGGVKPMSIAGRYVNERERLVGMTDAERAFRKQWLKDQELAANEPKVVPEMYKATFNPIRRFYKWPLDQFEKKLQPILGAENAHIIRFFTGKACMIVAGVYYFTYYFKYNKPDWTRKNGMRIMESRTACVKGDPGYPRLSDKFKGSDYAAQGFDKVTLNL